MSNQANTHAAWKDAQHFWTRQIESVTVEERDLLEDWEFTLCDASTLKGTVALLPRLQRCFKRVEMVLTERGEAVKKAGAKNLQLALRSRHKCDTAALKMMCLHKTRLWMDGWMDGWMGG